MARPTRVPGPLRLLGFFGQKPQAVGGETPPKPEPEEPEETCIALPLAEGGELVECPLCLLPQPPQAFPSLASCHHRSCRGCLEQYLRLAVGESRVPVACPHCPAALQPADVHRLLPEPALRDKYEEFLLRRLLAADPSTRWCPAPGCSYAVIAHGCAECPRLTCGREGCGTEFCYHCRQPWHPDSPCATTASGLASPRPEPLAQAEAEDIKVCPRCSAFITKINDGGCNRMSCPVCGCLFCWLCLREISDVHFLSPSGCTFWGKRPWSRTRRLLWQLGMVLGAPMVISLVVGIAVPVITIGIPIYMGRKVLGQSRRSNLSGCQQCLSVTSSVLLSLIMSPIITAVTVVNDLWSVLPSPGPAEDGVPDTATVPRRGAVREKRDSQAAGAAPAALGPSEGRYMSYGEGVSIEVEVSIEAVPRPALARSLSGQSLSGDSLGGTSDRCSGMGVPTE
ncbi:E3 ubiquitin-protein ligase RNF19B-like isoform X2 [Strix aluco]|uniref:E3 ubiquitin-protein ligase RNF19B-like isoform X2 n=1 Tax=Strix aluco TaxID=111821 RepID=UPI003DA2283F